MLIINTLWNIRKILKILQNKYVIVVKGYVLHQVFHASQSCIEQFPNVIKIVKLNDYVLNCKIWKNKIKLKRPLDLMLWDYIVTSGYPRPSVIVRCPCIDLGGIWPTARPLVRAITKPLPQRLPKHLLTCRLNMAPETSGQYIYLPMITKLYTLGAWRFPSPMITRLYTPVSGPQFRTSVSGPGQTDKWINKEDSQRD
jgi:hypothetical protein